MELKDIIKQLKEQKETFGIRKFEGEKDGIKFKAYTIGDDKIRIDVED